MGVPAVMANAGFRTMAEADEPTFQRLLQAVYGTTYSYQELYARGGYSRLVRSGKAVLAGELDAAGELVAHVAFVRKDPLGDYVEQGMAFRHPTRRSSASREEQAAAYRRVIADVAAKHTFIHQNVSTYHPLAQRFAKRMLNARAVGFIFDYSSNEALKSYSHADAPMGALVMTSNVRACPAQTVTLPKTPAGEWIARMYADLGLDRSVQMASEASAADHALVQAAEWTCFEANPALALVRWVLTNENQAHTGPLGLVVGPRVDLVHVPLSSTLHVGAAFTYLRSLGYLPVALRPHASRADEVVFQRTRKDAAADAIARAKFADASDAAMMQDWLRCV